MPLVSSQEWLLKAQKEKFGIGAFNANNMEVVEAVIETAEEEKSPVFLQISQGAIKYAGLEMATNMVRTAAELASIPVILHLDHGTDFKQNVKCLRAGFTSLMFDGSKLSFEENVKITSKVVEIAHACNIPVEAELGQVAQSKDKLTLEQIEALMTQPEEVKKFVELTKCDSLAPAIGSVHAMKTREAKLDIERLKRIRDIVSIPLVLHGSSGVALDSIREGIANGICKVNVATQLSMSFIKGCADALKANPEEVDIRKILLPGKQEVKEKVREYIKVFNSSGKGIMPGVKSNLTKSEIKHHE
ncbi:MAG: class II fructose-bisphosphate aldolase [Candidatus Firestonebacteria bacterium]